MSKKIIIALLSGASLTLGFAPFNLWFFTYLSLVLFIWLIDLISREEISTQSSLIKNYAIIAFIWGIGFFGSNVSWVFVSIYKYGGTNFFISGLITLLFILYLSVFPVINIIFLRKFNLTPKDWRFLIAFPSSWVLIEILRGWFLTGFPWGLLGYTQLNCFLKYYASLFGVHGVSLIVAFIASLLYWLIDKKITIKLLAISMIVVLVVFGYYIKSFSYANITKHKKLHGNHHHLDLVHKVAIIQGNIPPNDKFLLQSVTSSLDLIKKVYWQATMKLFPIKKQDELHKNIDLVIWPENSLPLDLNYQEVKNFLTEVDLFAKKNKFGLLIGAPIAAKKLITENYIYTQFYNSTLGLGIANGVYHKINLVPFGDYVPLEQLFRGLISFFNLPMSSFIAGKKKQPGILFKDKSILATICYDIAYGNLLRKRILELNPSVIVAISEDGWFGDSLGPHQHLDIARMRAIETGRFVLRATTSGISAIIDHNGNVIKRLPMFEKNILVSEYKDCFNTTLWNKIGNMPLMLFLLFCFISVAFLRRSK